MGWDYMGFIFQGVSTSRLETFSAFTNISMPIGFFYMWGMEEGRWAQWGMEEGRWAQWGMEEGRGM